MCSNLKNNENCQLALITKVRSNIGWIEYSAHYAFMNRDKGNINKWGVRGKQGEGKMK